MITVNAADFESTLPTLSPPERPAVLPKAVLLIRPTDFGLEEQSARDNRYMDMSRPVNSDRAHFQHIGLELAIRKVGVPVFVLPQRPDQKDGIFPNNVYATIPGTFIIGAMRHEARQREATRADVRALFTSVFRYQTLDLSQMGFVAELTGPLVIDRKRKIGFCGMTERVDESGLAAMHDAFGLDLVYAFSLVPGEYHTNVVLSVLAGRAVVLHRGSFADPATPDAISRCYGDAVIELDDAEKAAFAANCLALTERDVFLSAGAVRSLRDVTRKKFESLGFRLHAIETDEIERAGGSVRCLIAEIF